MTSSGRVSLSRRAFLRTAGATALSAVAPALIGCATQPRRWQADPFALGVASGEPSPDGFVLWTRLAPDPLSADPDTPGGMPRGDVAIDYEIATDPAMRTIVRRGHAIAEADYVHSVHLEVRGLPPGRRYWYRFRSGNAESDIGQAITAPAEGASVDRLTFGIVSCSNYEQGYFSAYRHLADESPDLVLFLGDYIYEFIERRRPTVRLHSDGVQANTLPRYRNRYAQYRTDPDLRRLHATAPCLMIWDDHEVQNDYAGQWSQTFVDPAKFLRRRTAAYRAFYEHMPVRPSRAHPNGASMRIYESFGFGDLVTVAMLDGRQYRSREACYGPPDRGRGHLIRDAECPERLEPSRSPLGPEQEAWLYDGLAASRTRWNVIGQDVLMAEFRQRQADGAFEFWSDDWNGYPAARERLLRHLHDSRVANPVVLSGDIHSFWANDLRLSTASGPVTVATEFVGTSITSPGVTYDYFQERMSDNPHVRFFDSRVRGYMAIELNPERMTTHFRAISDVRDPNASVSTLKSFVVERGKPGVVVA